MKSKLALIVAMLAALGMLMITTGCRTTVGAGYRSAPPPQGPPPWAPAHGRRAKHHYRYYRDAEVYYDAGRGLYFYLSGGNWQSSVRLPSYISISGSYVDLDMDADMPYRYHNDVKRHYPRGQMKKMDRDRGPSDRDRGKPDKGKGKPDKGKGKDKDRR